MLDKEGAVVDGVAAGAARGVAALEPKKPETRRIDGREESSSIRSMTWAGTFIFSCLSSSPLAF